MSQVRPTGGEQLPGRVWVTFSGPHRDRRGLSREELSALLNSTVSSDTIANVERGRTRPYRKTLDSLCAALDLAESERTALLKLWPAPNASEAFPQPVASRRLGRSPALAPVLLSTFIGRHRELKEIQGLLASARLLTLTGTGGVGKTRLAMEVTRARALSDKTIVAFVELAALADSTLVVQAVAASLNVRESLGDRCSSGGKCGGNDGDRKQLAAISSELTPECLSRLASHTDRRRTAPNAILEASA